MKWNATGRGLKALGVSLAVGLGMTACSRDYTVGYLYMTSATRTTSGLINAYAIDYQSGALTQLSDSPIPSGGNNPVGLVASPNNKFIYVLNNTAPSSNIVAFSIGTDGKLYAQATTPVVQGANGVNGSNPTAAAIDPAGKFLYTTFTYGNGFTPAKPGPGGLAVFPINADGSLGSPLQNTTVGTTGTALPYLPVGDNPVGVIVSPNATLSAAQQSSIAQLNYIYVINQEKPATGSPFGVIRAFTATVMKGGTTPVFAAIPGPVSGGFAVGTSPVGIAIEPAGHYFYVTDQATNQLYAFQIGTGGAPSALISSPYNTGTDPQGVTADPRGLFIYVANFGSSTVSAYAINQSTGQLSSSGPGIGVDTGPTCVTIEPATGIYLFTSNNLQNTVSAAQLDPHTGALKGVQGTPFSAQPLPTCVAAVANGAHATQIVQ